MATALRPLTVGELLDRTFFLYRRHFGLFVGIATLPNLILLAFNLVRTLTPDIVSSGAQLIAFFVGIVALVFVYLFTMALSQGATVVAVSQLQLDRHTSVSEAFGAIAGRIGAIAGIIVGMALRIMIGFLLFIIPGILWTIRWSLTIPIAVIEGHNLTDSLERSAQLTEGHRWRVFLIYALLIVLVYIVTLVLEVPLLIALALSSGLAPGAEMPVFAQVLALVTGFVTSSLLSPIMTIAMSLVYYDERVRKEAFDLQHMMEQLDQAAVKPIPAT